MRAHVTASIAILFLSSGCGENGTPSQQQGASVPASSNGSAPSAKTTLPTPTAPSTDDTDISTVMGAPPISTGAAEGPPDLVHDRAQLPLGIESTPVSSVNDVAPEFFAPEGLGEPNGIFTAPGDPVVALVYTTPDGVAIVKERLTTHENDYSIAPVDVEGQGNQPSQHHESIQLPTGPAILQILSHDDETESVNIFLAVAGLDVSIESVDGSLDRASVERIAELVVAGV